VSIVRHAQQHNIRSADVPQVAGPRLGISSEVIGIRKSNDRRLAKVSTQELIVAIWRVEGNPPLVGRDDGSGVFDAQMLQNERNRASSANCEHTATAGSMRLRQVVGNVECTRSCRHIFRVKWRSESRFVAHG